MNDEILIQRQQELFLTHYVIMEKGIREYNNLIARYGSLRNYLHEIGTNNMTFTGTFDPDKKSSKRMNFTQDIPSGNHLCESEGITPDLIGSIIPNGDNIGKLVGPRNEKPMVPRSFGVKLEREDDHYYTYGIMDHVKAILMYYGDRPLTTDGKNLLDFLEYNDFDFSTINFRSDRYCLEVKLEGEYCGNAGGFIVGSASCNNVTEHQPSLKQLVMIINGEYLFMDNTGLGGTTELAKKKFDLRPEFKDNVEPDKYGIMTLIALKQGVAYSNSLGHEIGIEVPENKPIDNLHYAKINGNLRTALTLYETIESPFLPNIQLNDELLVEEGDEWINKLFSRVIGEAVYLYYEMGWTERQVDHHIISKYGLDILTPKLKWDMIHNQKSMKERFSTTADNSGSGKIIKWINSPLYTATIKTHNGAVNPITTTLLFDAARDFKIHHCWVYDPDPEFNGYQFYNYGNVYTTIFGGYGKKGYKPKTITTVKKWNKNTKDVGLINIPAELFDGQRGKGQLNPDFYENPEKYTDFFKKEQEKLHKEWEKAKH